MQEVIACFGDSLIYGYPYGPECSWLRRVEELEPNIRMLNYGECGECTDDVLVRLRRTVLPVSVRYVVLLAGANDILQMRPLRYILKDISDMGEECKARGLEAIYVLPPLSTDSGFNAKVIPLRENIIQLWGSEYAVLDLQPAIGGSREELLAAYVDGIHPTAVTYKRMGEAAAVYLSKYLTSPTPKEE